MKKKNVINLIKYYTERNDAAFRDEAYEIAVAFNRANDHELGDYVMALLSDKNTFVPQVLEDAPDYIRKVEQSVHPLPLPECIKDELMGLVNAIGYALGATTFQGSWHGKTESANSPILNRQLHVVDFDLLSTARWGRRQEYRESVC